LECPSGEALELAADCFGISDARPVFISKKNRRLPVGRARSPKVALRLIMNESLYEPWV